MATTDDDVRYCDACDRYVDPDTPTLTHAADCPRPTDSDIDHRPDDTHP